MLLAEPLFYAIAIPAVMLSGISKGGFGGGLGILTVPMLALVVAPWAKALHPAARWMLLAVLALVTFNYLPAPWSSTFASAAIVLALLTHVFMQSRATIGAHG